MAKGCSPNKPCLYPASMWAKQMMYPSASGISQASNISVTYNPDDTVELSWQSGGGSSRIVVVYDGSITNPTNGASYTANTVFGSGSAIGAGFVVYNGSGDSVTISGLEGSTTYNVKVFESDGSSFEISDSTNNPSTIELSTVPLPTLTDYIGSNLYDWWTPQRGVIADTNNTAMDSWDGYVNNVRLTPVQTTEDIPVNGAWTMDLTNGGLVLPNNPGINATDFTFIFYIRKNGSHGAASWLLDTVGPTPRCILKFEISNVNANAGIQFNGVDLDFGYAIPKDNVYRTVAFVFSGTNCKLMIDGVQQGSTLTGLTGGQIALNTSVTRRLFRGGSTLLNPFNGDVKGFRIYKEAVSDANLVILSTTGNAFVSPIPQRNARVFSLTGQSNMEGSGAWGTLPVNLQGTLSRCFLFNNNTRVFAALSSSLYTLSSPILAFAYKVSQTHPNDDVFIIMTAVGGTTLAVDWLPPAGSRYTNMTARNAEALVQLGIQNRTISQKGGAWSQGETDAQVLANANNYLTNLGTYFTAWRAAFGHTVIAHPRLHNSLPAGSYPYRTTVNSAKDTYAAGDSNNKSFNTDDTGIYPRLGDNLHYDTTGMCACGEQMGSYF